GVARRSPRGGRNRRGGGRERRRAASARTRESSGGGGGMNRPKGGGRKGVPPRRNRHWASTYPLSEPISTDRATAGIVRPTEFQKFWARPRVPLPGMPAHARTKLSSVKVRGSCHMASRLTSRSSFRLVATST